MAMAHVALPDAMLLNESLWILWTHLQVHRTSLEDNNLDWTLVRLFWMFCQWWTSSCGLYCTEHGAQAVKLLLMAAKQHFSKNSNAICRAFQSKNFLARHAFVAAHHLNVYMV